MTTYETLLRLAFRTPADVAHYLTPATLGAYPAFEAAGAREQPFRFEQWRLGVALSLLRMLGDLGDHAEARAAADVLHRALNTAASPQEIDKQIGKENKLFEQIYTNLYVNDEGEALLDLFARTLDADSPDFLAQVEFEAVDLAREVDFDARYGDEDED
ncbi:hypothetical protein GO988_11005 [Hymenobacter sp. HMF4947]|uniref:Uncharacterized protein n=1 Tax=Hymenobacter ginkgonis TaxID=2682976 RepID=A0A7K1TEY2_9BACT|nr:hypothetical protein [Hymenobacter ginkgonis]MVN76852.1 hypothetical protein [Hymenobacter ginkgonis]